MKMGYSLVVGRAALTSMLTMILCSHAWGVGRLGGTVTTSCDGSPIANANVTLTNTTTGASQTTTTRSDGSYQFGSLDPSQQYDVSVSVSGFQPFDKGAPVSDGTQTTVDFALWSASSICVQVDPKQPIAGVPATISLQVPFGWYGRVHFGTDVGDAARRSDDLPWDYTFTPQDAARKSFSATFNTPNWTTVVVSSLPSLPSSIPAISGSAQILVQETPPAPPLPAVTINPGLVIDGSVPLPLVVSDIFAAPSMFMWLEDDCAPNGTFLGPLCVQFNRGINTLQQQLNGATASVPVLSVASPNFSIPIEEIGWQPLQVGFNYVGSCPENPDLNTTKMDLGCKPVASSISYDVSVQAWIPSDPGSFGTPFESKFAGHWEALPQPGDQGNPFDQLTTLPVTWQTEYGTYPDWYSSGPTVNFPVLPIAVRRVDTFLRIGVRLSFTSSADNPNLGGSLIYPGSDSGFWGAVPVDFPGDCANTSPQWPCVDLSGTDGDQQWIFGPAFLVHVVPNAQSQQEVHPFLLVYQPPGDESSQTVTLGTAAGSGEGFSLSFGSSIVTGNSHSTSDEENFTSGFTGPYGNYSSTFGDKQNWSTQTDVTTTTATEQSVVYSQSTFSSQSFSALVANSPFPPDPTSTSYTFFEEPFWGDRFYLLVNPKYSLWNLSTCADRSLPPCTGLVIGLTAVGFLGADKQYASASVEQLYKCMAPEGGLQAGPYLLTPQQCYQIAKLDPFFTGVIVNAQDPSIFFAGQAQPAMAFPQYMKPVTPNLYGFGVPPDDPMHPLSVQLSTQQTASAEVGTAQSASFQSTTTYSISNCTSASTSAGYTSPFGAISLMLGIGSCSGESNGFGISTANGQRAIQTTGTTLSVQGVLSDSRSIFLNAFNATNPYLTAPTYTLVVPDSVNGDWAFVQPNLPPGPGTASLPPPVVSSVSFAVGNSGAINIAGTNFFDAVTVSFGTPVLWPPGGNVQMWNPAPTPYSISEDGTKITVYQAPPRPAWLSGTGSLTVDVIVVTPSGASLPNAGDQYTYPGNLNPAPPMDRRLGITAACMYATPVRQIRAQQEVRIQGWGFLRANTVRVGSMKYSRISRGEYYRKPGFMVVDDRHLMVAWPGITNESAMPVTVISPALHVSSVARKSVTCPTDR